MAGSPPPSRAETVISRESFVKRLPRLASLPPFWRLICDQCECPPIGASLARLASEFGANKRMADRSVGYAAGMLVFDRGEQRFCYRVAAVIIDRGRVLIQLVEEGPDTSETPFYCLPGGRVEHGETALEGIDREMREELEEDVRVERLLWFIENFFE